MSPFGREIFQRGKQGKSPFAALSTTVSQSLALLMLMSPCAPAHAGKGLLPPAPAADGKSYFYASRRACASAGQFSEQDCAAAFERVDALLRERVPKFADKIDCVVQFKLCERDDAEGYLPAVLGVEIVRAPKGLVALPMLAIETPAELLRDPEPPPPDRGYAADGEPLPRRTGAPSPYGVLALEAANLAPVTPPSIKSYRRYIEEVQLRQTVYQQGAKPNPMWRAER